MGKYFYLREVSFVKVCFDVEALLGFINLCPALEDFSIMLCNGLESLFIPYLPKLERLTVAVCENAFRRVDIKATDLQSFCYEALARSSIVDELDISISAHTQLREVYIGGVNNTENLLEALVSKLSLLRNLTLTRCSSMERVKIAHHLLEMLSLCLHNGLLQLEIETPNLRYFKYGADILPDVFSINAPNLQESYLELLPRDCVDTHWFLNMRRYLSNFERLDELSLSFGRSMNTFSLDKLNEYETPPLPVVKHLKAERVGFIRSCDAWLDGLLWSCHPEIFLVEYGYKSDVQFIRFLSEKLINRDEYHRCCDSNRIRCWRHCIKDVMNEDLMVSEDRDAFLSSFPSKGRGFEVRFQLKW